MPRTVLTSHECYLVATATRLRRTLWATHADLAREFSSDLNRGWAERGLHGMASACWALSQALANTPGGWDAYTKAKALGYQLAACPE